MNGAPLIGAALAATVLLGPAHAADLSTLYSDAVLAERQARYEPNIRWNFDNVVLGSLTPAERRRLGPVRLEVPLRGAGASRGHPLAFYAGAGTVTVPVQSVKFFDDLALAWAVLTVEGAGLEPVTDYVSMLKYRDPADLGGRHPAPLDALGVAPDAWRHDAKIDDISQKALKSALVWIMAHEVGHLLHGHLGYEGVSAEDAQPAETEADRFANTVMRRIGVAPLGMVQFFMTMAHYEPNRADFDSEAAWRAAQRERSTHPLTADRLRALADDLRRAPEEFVSTEPDVAAGVERIRAVAAQVSAIADTLADPDIQRAMAAAGLATDPAALKRWRRARDDAAGAPFEGRYEGRFDRRLGDGTEETLAGAMELVRQGDTVVGRFTFGLGEGAVRGIVRGDRMVYEWQWGNSYGRGTLRHDPATGALEGAWGYDDAREGGGRWALARP